MTRHYFVPMKPLKRDPVLEPHDLSPRWLGEGKAAVWKPVEGEGEDEVGERTFVPKKLLPCHGEENQRLGFIRKSDGVEVAFERVCRTCKIAEQRRAEESAWDAVHNHEERVVAFLKRKHVRVLSKGRNRGFLPTKWEGE